MFRSVINLARAIGAIVMVPLNLTLPALFSTVIFVEHLFNL